MLNPVPIVHLHHFPTMAINVLQAAKHLCEVSNYELTNLELQKIIYISHMNYLGENKKPLVRGNFEAWKLGPVHPKLYHHVKQFCANPVEESVFSEIKDLNPEHEKQTKILEDILEIFPSGSANVLIEVTHWVEGAWKKVYVPSKNNVIPQKYILDEYNEIITKKPWG